MGSTVKLGLFIYLIFQLLISGPDMLQVGLVLMLVALAIARVKYWRHSLAWLMELALTGYSMTVNPHFSVLLAGLAFDLVFEGRYWGMLFVAVSLWLLPQELGSRLLFLLALCGYFGLVARQQQEREQRLQAAYDQERKMRFQLEEVRDQLLTANREVAHLTEIKERNRIAGTIHDHVGHQIAGLLMQLQVVEKLFDRDREKSRQLLEKSVRGLSQALVYLRETVHNIRSAETVGLAAIQEVIDGFLFCPVQFKPIGDINSLHPQHFHLLLSIMKEALTNIAKHSRATEATVRLEVNEQFVRLYIKDDGVGCKQIKVQLGLGGMEERVRNLNGTLSINGEKGFLLVCVLPQQAAGRWNL